MERSRTGYVGHCEDSFSLFSGSFVGANRDTQIRIYTMAEPCL